MQVKLIDREAVVYLVDELEAFEKDKAIKSGLRAASGVLIRKGRSNLKQRLKGTGKGSLAGAFVTKVKRNKLGSLAGFRRSTKLTQWSKAGNHAHLVDRGTRKRPHPITGNSGIMLANNFWSDARVSEESNMMNALFKGVERAVQRINNRRK